MCTVATQSLARAGHKPTGDVPVITKEVFLALPVLNRAILRLMEQDGEVIIQESAGSGGPGKREDVGTLAGGLL